MAPSNIVSSRWVRYIAFLIAVYAWLPQNGVHVSASMSLLCSDRCTSTSDCTTECYFTEEDIENGYVSSCLDYGVYDQAAACCGDHICDQPEEGGSCDADCGTSGIGCNECNSATNSGCSSGQLCNAEQCCYNVPVCTGSGCDPAKNPPCYEDYCQSDGDCCSGDHCYWIDREQDATGFCVPNAVRN
jgi:hypothetical protein